VLYQLSYSRFNWFYCVFCITAKEALILMPFVTMSSTETVNFYLIYFSDGHAFFT